MLALACGDAARQPAELAPPFELVDLGGKTLLPGFYAALAADAAVLAGWGPHAGCVDAAGVGALFRALAAGCAAAPALKIVEM
jgi:hypothetical protein